MSNPTSNEKNLSNITVKQHIQVCLYNAKMYVVFLINFQLTFSCTVSQATLLFVSFSPVLKSSSIISSICPVVKNKSFNYL